MTDVIDGTAEDVGEMEHGFAAAEASSALVPRAAAYAVTPNVQAGELVARLDVIREAMHSAMREGIDYGRIPGVDKPTLLKPGAEKLGVLFQLDVQLANTKTWGPGEHLTVETKATVYHVPTGQRLGFGEGLATTREKKHAKRKQERECPQCGVSAIIKGKAEYGGGWVCFKKKNGCGAKFRDGDPAIEDQHVGEIENPDLPDSWNPVVKMAAKRARVDAVLAVTGASALFTQDVEDNAATEQPAAAANGEQVARVKSLVRSLRVTTAELRMVLRDALVPEGVNPVPVVEALTAAQAVAVADVLEHRPVPTGQSDVPNDFDPEESARIEAETAAAEAAAGSAQTTLEEAGSAA
jgi:hypothetical protein